MAEKPEKPTPAYFPWRTFENFVVSLKNTAVPPVIDGSVMRSMSGSTQSQIRTGLRFLGLTTDADAVTSQFRKLIEAHGEAGWSDEMGQVIGDAYAHITEGLDLDNGTQAQLTKHFRDQGGATGSVLTKSVRFFLAAMKSAGWKYSPHFEIARQSGTQNGNGPKKSRRKRASKSDSARGRSKGVSTPPPGTERLQLAIPGKSNAVIDIPEGMTEQEWQMVDTYVRSYVGLKG